MNGDPIGEHARALRESHDGTSADAAATRRRILAMAYTRARRRRRLFVVLAPLAAVFLLSTAWAAVTGRLPRVISLFTATRAPAAPVTSPTRAAAVGPTEATAPVPAVESPSASQVEEGPSPPPSAHTPPIASIAKADPQATGRPAAPSRAPRADDAPADAEASLYAAAHHAHFEARDPEAALRAWNAYLAAYPDGRFALEARYNRALALVRLGRAADARAALAPFADGSYGGYRRAEARALMDALPPQ
jgi:hypothetical protein